MIVKIFIFLLSTCYLAEGIRWKLGNDGQVKWSKHCNIDGNAIGHIQIRSEECGSACLAKENCYSFAWTSFEGGTCWFKDGTDAHRDLDTPICGKIIKQNTILNNTEHKVNKTSKVIHSDSSEENSSTLTKSNSDDDIFWQSGDNGQVQWAQFCDFSGNKIGNVKIRSEDCGSACLENENCSSFSWTYSDGGMCWLKDGGDAHQTMLTPMCGKVLHRDSVRKIV